MLNHFPTLIYGLIALLLLVQAIRVMSQGFIPSHIGKQDKKRNYPDQDDRTGQITIHPEILNQDGDITDEDLLTVRFSSESDPPESLDKSS